MDALQAYICAVQLDKNHSAAWTNLGNLFGLTKHTKWFLFLKHVGFVLRAGILYETSNQPRDALACYVNSARGSVAKNHGKGAAVHPNLLQRTKFLQQQLQGAPTPTTFSKYAPFSFFHLFFIFFVLTFLCLQFLKFPYFLFRPRLLPSIEDAWNLPITAEMNSRQQQMQQRGGQGVFPRGPAFPPEGPSQAKRFKVEGQVEGGAAGGPRPPMPSFYLTQQQIQMMNYLQQQGQNSLTPQQHQLLQQLQNHFRMMQQHQQQTRMQQQQQQQLMMRPGQQQFNRPAAPYAIGTGPQQTGYPRAGTPQSAPMQQQQSYPNMSCPPALSSPSGVNVSDQELQVE